jgi:hypothetical protein
VTPLSWDRVRTIDYLTEEGEVAESVVLFEAFEIHEKTKTVWLVRHYDLKVKSDLPACGNMPLMPVRKV